MMMGFNTTPISEPFQRFCVVCEGGIFTPNCHPRNRVEQDALQIDVAVTRDDDVLLYDVGNAVAVSCVGCVYSTALCADGETWMQPTPAQTQVVLYLQDGNVFAYMNGGRIGQLVEIAAVIKLQDDTLYEFKTALIIEDLS